MKWFGIVTLLIGAVVAGCGGSETPSVSPRPVGWHRINVAISDTMTEAKGVPVRVLVNPTATYELVDGELDGLTVTYPGVGATIYYTFIKPKDGHEKDIVLENRRKRIELNLNGAPAETYHDKSEDDKSAVLVVATSGTQTPVQLLADMGDYIVTATGFLSDANAVNAYDSIRPLTDLLKHDMSRSLPSIKFLQLP